ncbi:hypothetical protein Q2T40_12685 [Winogradskyella maritima]|uniref:Uncharacterized protein n=1 Tax=Winogradskyella maritima TaxID=1517766 RepID=A0ABV8AHC6_9FLAO|nr:hypothetical protein [Winogradskyella maritima]
MKSKIHSINQHLLKRYPLLWNTRVLWMLSACLLLHIVFFIIGSVTVSDVEILQERGAVTLFFESGIVFFSIMVSILAIVVWLIFLFKNNGFKSYYPTSKSKLFLEYIIYFIIFFFAISFYFSYMIGLKFMVNQQHPDNEFKANIELSNRAHVFFSHNLADYELSNRRYPEPFDTLYCEARETMVITERPYFNFLNKYYQYWSLKKDSIAISDYDYDDRSNCLFPLSRDGFMVCHVKDSLMDVSRHVNTVQPSYFNFSRPFFSNKRDASDSYVVSITNPLNEDLDRTENILINKDVHQLLSRNNPEAIKKLLSEFLDITEDYKIKSNLTVESWFYAVYHPENFEVKKLIGKSSPMETSLNYNVASTEFQKYASSITSKLYLKSDDLFQVYDNISDIKKFKIFNDGIHVFLWLAFGLSCLLFGFRITSSKIFIFSVVTGGILIIVVSLVTVAINYLIDYAQGTQYLIYFFMLSLAFAILSIPYFFIKTIKRMLSGIAINLSLVMVPLTILLILVLITSYQTDNCLKNFRDFGIEDNHPCPNILGYFGFDWSYIILVASLIFIFLFTTKIRQWRALPEQ